MAEELTSYLPNVGDRAPAFEADTEKGFIKFPEYSAGHWCVLLAHPANFTSAWTMYASFMAMKERWLLARQTKLIAVVNDPVRQNDWQEKVRRYLGIYLKAPVVEDPDYAISNLYGLASNRRPLAGHDRVILIIDPEGVIRLVVNRPLPSLQAATTELQRELDRLQGNDPAPEPTLIKPIQSLLHVNETPDIPAVEKGRPAYIRPKELILN